jgi:choline monooxygenase
MTDKLRELLALFDASLPLEKARTIPAAWYFDQEMYQAERRAVFGGVWQAAGRADQVAEPGSFFTADIAGEPILVVRDAGGVLRAFFNVCRHRAARVVQDSEGKATRLRCPYHGWTYDLAGHLRGVPEFEGVADFSREQNGLVGMAVDTWGPLVWVLPAADSGRHCPRLEEFLAPLSERTADLGLEKLHFAERREYVLECNWKVFVDNYLDGGYHVNYIHPGLAGVLDYSRYRTEIAGNTSVQISPMRTPDSTSDDRSAAAVRTGETAYYWWIFPNLMVNLYQGIMDTNLVLPLGTDRCKVIFDFYFDRQRNAASEKFIAESIAVSHQIQLEDVGICEQVQQGLRSRSYKTGRFSVRREQGGYHFHRLLAEYLAKDLDGHASWRER